jgi:hypothetical protein
MPANRSALRLVRIALGYSALAVGVTVGGVAIGALVVAPVVSRGSQSFDWRITVSRVVDWTREFGANITVPARPSWMNMAQVPSIVWMAVGMTAALALTGMIAWRWRRHANSESEQALSAIRASLTGSNKVSGAREGRTPRAVLALAEAGTAPADIARRTGMPLDAVVLCLSMSSFGARQLQPPTA